MLFLLVPFLKMMAWMCILAVKGSVLMLRGTWLLLALMAKATMVLVVLIVGAIKGGRQAGKGL